LLGFLGGGTNLGYCSIVLSRSCLEPQFLPERFEFGGEFRKIDLTCATCPDLLEGHVVRMGLLADW